MKNIKLVVGLLVITGIGFGDGEDKQATLWPNGAWFLCENNPGLSMCEGFQSGGETYMISVKVDSQLVYGYHWRVTGVLKSNGEKVVKEGSFLRQDNSWGFTSQVVDLGGVLEGQGELEVWELMPVKRVMKR